MANLSLDLNIISARNLVNVNLITRMDVYGVITIQGDATQNEKKVKTAVDRSGGCNPTWNHAVEFSVDERLARDSRLTLAMRLTCRRVLGNKNIGGVNVLLLELLKSCTPSIKGDVNGQEMTFVTYQVKSPSGKRKGYLTFAYRFNKTPIKPEIPAVLNRSSVGTEGFSPTSYPPPSAPSEIEHLPSVPPERSTECRQVDSDHRKHLLVAGSSFDPLPVSYGGAGSSPYDEFGYAYHHRSPPQSSNAYFAPPETRHQGYGPYGSATPSPPKGIGLGLLGGLIMGDIIVSDVVNCFDL
ncbi:hypothetical protein IGI04_030833 [Brassica rapa subsp. trilocularis]|uniref:C2 domain-containing protein n=1 Tax=Brassica rapa subsp. trilocularis TaxID=1813537 RepID=A0ABQ7LSQ5_BRACM|nr:hypothetical protein IGI04_030833 [Brassica rapa subsp. trilocularis]